MVSQVLSIIYHLLFIFQKKPKPEEDGAWMESSQLPGFQFHKLPHKVKCKHGTDSLIYCRIRNDSDHVINPNLPN